MIKKISLIICLLLIMLVAINHTLLIRLFNDYQSLKLSKNRSKLYQLNNQANIKDITEALITDDSVPQELKKQLISKERKILIFKYPSDGNWVAGYLSYLTHSKQNPTVIFLRGGNRFFGIMRPNNRFSFLKGYNVVGTLYRGNIYGGKDEFGGQDVNDVENLIKFFPQLEYFSKIKLQAPFAMIGASRGALEMVLALNRSEQIRRLVNKAISVSGNLDLQITQQQRPDMRYLFKSLFKDSSFKNFDEWLAFRNPVNNLTNLPKSLKTLILYGLADNRVSIQEQLNFQKALEQEQIHSKLITITGASHDFDTHYDQLEYELLKFLEDKN